MSGKERPAWPGNAVSVTTESSVIAEQCTGRGATGVVCAAAPLAAQAGATAMRDGGNAFDAVVCAALAETVLLPSKCGLGGDLVAIVLRAGAARPRSVAGDRRSARGLAEVAEPAGPGATPARCRWARPAAPAGYLALARRRAAAPRPPRRAGDRAGNWRVPVGRRQPPPRRRQRRTAPAMESRGHHLPPDGEPIAAGALVTLPGLARALASFVELGDGFLAGPVGDAIVATVQHARRRPRPRRSRSCAGRVDRVRRSPTSARARCGRRLPRPTVRRCSPPSPTPQPGDDPATQYRRVLAAINRGSGSTRRPVGHVDRQRRRPRRQRRCRRPLQLLPALRQRPRRRRLRPGPRQPRRPRLHAGSGTPELPSRWPPSGNDAARLGGIRRQRTPAVPRRHAGRRQPGRPGMPSCCRGSSTGESAGCPGDGAALGVAAGRRRRAHRGGIRRGSRGALCEASAPRAVSVGRWGLPCAQQVIAVPEDGRAIVGAADPRTVGLALGV